MELVIDASIALAWYFRNERNEATAGLLERVQPGAARHGHSARIEMPQSSAMRPFSKR